MSLPLKLREAEADDLNFILSSWLKSFRDAQRIPDQKSAVWFNWPRPSNEVFFNFQQKLIVRLLQRSKCLVAVNPEDLSQVYGFIVYENNPDIIHYVYVKSTFRKMGICKLLLSKSVEQPAPKYTHVTYAVEFLAPKLNAEFNPYLIWEKK